MSIIKQKEIYFNAIENKIPLKNTVIFYQEKY
jgi:hypothetical protein